MSATPERCGAPCPNYPGEYTCEMSPGHGRVRPRDKFVAPGQWFDHAAPSSGAAWLSDPRPAPSDLRAEADRLRRQADALESQHCTGVAARWCPVHGNCTCPDYDDGMRDDHADPDCSLHGGRSTQARLREYGWTGPTFNRVCSWLEMKCPG